MGWKGACSLKVMGCLVVVNEYERVFYYNTGFITLHFESDAEKRRRTQIFMRLCRENQKESAISAFICVQIIWGLR
jgi:hypothetical protein